MAPSSLYDAVDSGSSSTVRKYIRSKKYDSRVDWDIPRNNISNNWTPLMLAVYEGYDRIVRELLKHKHPGPRIEASSGRSLRTPLIEAARKDRYRSAQLLLRANPDYSHVDVQDRANRDTAFLLAIRQRNWTTMRVILGYNPDVSLLNANGDGPIHFAIKARNISLVKRILDGRGGRQAAKQKNSEGNAPLHLAVLSGVDILVQEVLDAGARKSDTNVWGETAEYVASGNGNYSAARVIQLY